MKQNQDYKNEALRALSGSWPHSLVATIIYLAILSFLALPSYMINFGITFPSYISGLSRNHIHPALWDEENTGYSCPRPCPALDESGYHDAGIRAESHQ